MTKQMIESLEAISEQVWKDDLNDSAFNALKKKVSVLSAQIGVHQALQKGRLLLPLQNSNTSVVQSRVGKVVDVVFRNPNSENYGKFDKFEARWQQLRDMDCTTFLFIATSYTPLEITKSLELSSIILWATPRSSCALKLLLRDGCFAKRFKLR